MDYKRGLPLMPNRWSPGCNCCFEAPTGYVYCDNCIYLGLGISNAPRYMTIEIDDLANDNCGDCPDYNATYLAENQTPTDTCEWLNTFSSICGSGSDLVRVRARAMPASKYVMHGELKIFGGAVYEVYGWADTEDTNKRDCLNYHHHALTIDPLLCSYFGNFCDPEGSPLATFHITSGDHT